MGWVLLLLPLVDPPANTGGPAAPAARSQVPLVLAVSTAPTPGETTASQDAPRTSPPVEPQQSAEPVDPDQASGMPTMQFADSRMSPTALTTNRAQRTPSRSASSTSSSRRSSQTSSACSPRSWSKPTWEQGRDRPRAAAAPLGVERLSERQRGRYHTAIGWYNTAYHHSAWMQTAIGRPLLFAFETTGDSCRFTTSGFRSEAGSRRAASGCGTSSRSATARPRARSTTNRFRTSSTRTTARPSTSASWRDRRAAGSKPGSRCTTTRWRRRGAKIGRRSSPPRRLPDLRVEWLNEVVYVRNATADDGPVSDTVGFYTRRPNSSGVAPVLPVPVRQRARGRSGVSRRRLAARPSWGSGSTWPIPRR